VENIGRRVYVLDLTKYCPDPRAEESHHHKEKDSTHPEEVTNPQPGDQGSTWGWKI